MGRKSKISARTIRRVVNHLETLNLEVIGPVYDPNTHEVGPPHASFDADKIIKYRRDALNDKLIYIEVF